MVSIWIATAFVAGLVVRQVGLPPLVGFLVAGFALNFAGIEPHPVLEQISHMGVLLLLFTVGLKTKLKSVFRPEVIGGALLPLVGAGIVLLAVLVFVLQTPSRAGLLLAVTLGFSSTVVAAKILEGKRELRAFHGRVAIGILIMQDLVAVALLTVVGGHAPSIWAFLLIALFLVQPLIKKLINVTGHGELLVLLGLVLALAIGGSGFESVGLSSELGALVLGAMVADHPKANELGHTLWGLKEALLVGFFLQIGMSGLPDWEACRNALVLLALLPIKAALFFFALILFRLRARTSFLAAVALASYSEFALIVALIAAKNGMISAEWLPTLSVSIAASFAVAAPLNRHAHQLYEKYQNFLCRWESSRHHLDDEPVTLGAAEIVIVGIGRVGAGAYDFLKARHERVVGLDSDLNKVQRHLGEGRRVVFADAEDPGFWQRLHLDSIKVFLLAMPDMESKRFAIRQLRARGFSGLISATFVYPEQGGILEADGASTAFNYYSEAGVGFAEHTWEALHPAEH